ncbi:transposase [Marinobacter salinus]|uniref:Transposase n=1 Tax=Marinobacter salinus TaxID=1874317 RepID=A0A1D9GR14_9GAMM|nr:transposase [Marinobacter salinus]
MPRQARVIVPGFPHHIAQRGHNRQPVFVERRDFEYYLANLRKPGQIYFHENQLPVINGNRARLGV